MFRSARQPSIPFAIETSSRVVGGEALEVRIFWGNALLDVVELSPPRAFFVGDGARSKLPVDFTVPDAGFERVPLVAVEHGAVAILIPAGANAVVRDVEGKREAAEPVGAESVTLDDRTVVDVRLGELTFSLRLGARETRCPRVLVADADVRPFAFFGLAAILGAAFLGSIAFFTPPLGLTDDESLDRDRLFLIQQYLDVSSEREREPDKSVDKETAGGVDAPAEKARGEAGKIGRRDLTAQNLRGSDTEAGEHMRPATSRAEQISQAANFGVIGLLSTGAAAAALPAAWDDSGIGQAAVAGGFFGTEIGEIGGLNGLALGGPGEGGGGLSNQIGLASIGTCRGQGCTEGLRFGIGSGRTGPDHLAKAPRLRTDGNTVVDGGSLPPEVIQRVVRQSFGRFRGCYEDGLRTNPNLEGRVTARFVIARDGSVATVQSGGTDLPDPRVVACVLRAYSSLTFPSPKNGIVRVTYPLAFSPAA